MLESLFKSWTILKISDIEKSKFLRVVGTLGTNISSEFVENNFFM